MKTITNGSQIATVIRRNDFDTIIRRSPGRFATVDSHKITLKGATMERLEMMQVLKNVCANERVDLNQVLSALKTKQNVRVRDRVVWLLHEVHRYSYPTIAEFFGRRSHSAFIACVKRENKRRYFVGRQWEEVETELDNVPENERAALLETLKGRLTQ